MRKIIFYFLILITNYSFGQTKNSDSASGFIFLDSVFKAGEFIYEIDQIELPDDVRKIMGKFTQSMAQNKEWFEDYFNKNYKAGEGLPYNEKFGITKEEYNKIKDLDKLPPKIKTVSLCKVTAIRKDSMLMFSGDENFKLFDFIVINFRSKKIKIGNDIIPYSSEINAPATTLFGKWHGYSWILEKTNEPEELKIDDLTSKIIKFQVGKTLANNKTLLIIKYQETDSGKIKTNIDVFGFIK